MKGFLFLAVLFLLAGTNCLAQERPIVSNDPPPPAARFPVVRETGKAQVVYDAKIDSSISKTKNSLVYGKSLDGIVISAQFSSPGKKVVKPEKIVVKIYPSAKDRTYVDDRTFRVYVGKKKVVEATSTFVGANSDGRV